MSNSILSPAQIKQKSLWDRFLHIGEAELSEDEAASIRATRLGTVLSNTPWMMGANVANAILTSIVFVDSPVAPAILTLCGLLILLFSFTGVTWWRSRNAPQRQRASIKGVKRAVVYAALIAGFWAILAIMTYSHANDSEKLVIVALTVGMAGGGGFALATIPAAAIAFTGVLGLGGAIALMTQPALIGVYLFALYIVYSAIIIGSSLRLCASLTERDRAKLAADEKRDLIGLLLNDFEENATDWLWGTDEQMILRRASPRLSEQIGQGASELLGYHFADVIPFSKTLCTMLAKLGAREDVVTALDSRQPFRNLEICVEVGGRHQVWSLSGKPIFDILGEFRGYRGVGNDITATREARLRIEHLARHDTLTGLSNRTVLSEDLLRAVSHLERFGDKFSVLLLDLDRFKQVNDTHGHGGGDELLQVVAKIIHDLCDERDTVARLGGDEFAIIQFGGDGAAQAADLASRIIQQVSTPLELSSGAVHIGISIGIACAPNDGFDADSIMRNADLALYRAKSDGRNRFRFFDVSLDAHARRRNQIEQELRLALAEGTLTLHAQPLVMASNGEVVCVEALVRWNHAQLGTISPAEFIPIAEGTGQILDIGSWVIRMACKAASKWPETVRVAINLSPRQFSNPALLPTLEKAIRENNLSPGRVELEVTESLLLDPSPAVETTLLALRILGVRIALDDFGTGYSSLSYLKRYKFDKLKIDQTFITDLDSNPDSAAIVASVITLARNLNLSVAAEGVEKASQFDRLAALGCSEIQGFLISKPMPIDDLNAFIQRNQGSLRSRRTAQA
ncbi:EAL domain-containing protein [Peteryoungia desertarenae]|uniref:EAL domain-containing protein n=1 Tax=Peteryoungia desertarenae TaxID=1813451 RepID=A0ABX6QRK2_9HYPH|nr:EAL domain-containing protein [Peteryoungia desertarenae]QLF70795.1 EAL domain-containing protein [Peteryoungia desertarenae]